MGDRGNIKIISAMNEAPPLYFYTHWNGSELPVIIVNAMKRVSAAGRSTDEAYASRIIFDTLTENANDASTGYGIASWPAGDADTIITVDFSKSKVDFGHIALTFDDVLNIEEV